MKRWLVTIAIFFLAGALVNVAVAWGCAAFAPIRFNKLIKPPVQLENDSIAPSYGVRTAVRSGSYTGVGHARVDWALMDWEASVSEDEFADAIRRGVAPSEVNLESTYLAIWQSGFPMRCLTGETFARVQMGRLGPRVHANLWALPGWLGRREKLLPLKPIWRGTAVNTLFYAVILAAVYLIVWGGYALAFRRLIRTRLGLCPGCGYPMGESAVCSECGKPLPGRAGYPAKSVRPQRRPWYLGATP